MPRKKGSRFRPSDSRISITITPEGKIIHHMDINSLNAYLNREVDDPRLRGREWNPDASAPTIILAYMSFLPPDISISQLRRDLEDKGIKVLDSMEQALPPEIVEAVDREQPDLIVVVINDQDAKNLLEKLYSALKEQSHNRVIVAGSISRSILPTNAWRMVSRAEARLILRHIRELIEELRKIRDSQ